jgi:AraC-like DNA-binding protein
MLSSTIDVLWTARYDYQPGWALELHHHTYFQIIHFLSGKGTFRLAENNLPIRAGLLVLIKPDEMHGANASSLIKTLDIKFRVRNTALRKALLAAPMSALEPGQSIPELLERIRFEGERKGPYYRDICRALMEEILLLYLRAQSGNSEKQPNVDAGQFVQDPLSRKVVEYIRHNYSSPVEVKDIAKALGCCDRSLRLHFRSALGVRPLEYLHQYRIARAKELIEYSDYSLKETAVRVGFKNVQHFTRLFTASEGMSPGAWRQHYREGIRKDVCINPRFSNPNWTRPVSAASPLKPQ